MLTNVPFDFAITNCVPFGIVVLLKLEHVYISVRRFSCIFFLSFKGILTLLCFFVRIEAKKYVQFSSVGKFLSYPPLNFPGTILIVQPNPSLSG